MFKSMKIALTGLIVCGHLVACGGSNDGSSTIVDETDITIDENGAEGSDDSGSDEVESQETWVAGVFPDYRTLADRCELPRSGSNAFGEEYTDVQGTALDEKMWMRSWSNDSYLWYDEVEDQDPELFTISDYFDELVTTELTSSGRPKDNFHFSIDTAEYEQSSQSGVSSGYGMRLVIDNSSPRSVIVADVEPDSPAALGGIARGASILEVDGASITSDDIDTLNAGLFPSNAGEAHSLVILDRGEDASRTVTLTSADVETATVKYVRTIEQGDDVIGYFSFSSFIFPSEAALANAMQELQDAGVNELVLDLRYNGGGLLTVASQLAYMIAGSEATNGEIFEVLQFNDKYPTTNPITGTVIEPDGFQSTAVGFSLNPGTNLPSLDLDRVFILAGGNTCSASESVINGLRGIDVEVILIGKTTCGKPYGFYPDDNCGTTYFTVQFQGANAKGFGEYPDGFSPAESSDAFGVSIPGCDVEDDLTNALGDVNEARLAAALHYIEQGTCPAVTETEKGSVDTSEKLSSNDISEDPLLFGRKPWESIRIYEAGR